MRRLVLLLLFAAALTATLSGEVPGQQPQPKKKAAKVDPAANKPDEATLKQIAENTEQLRQAVAKLTGFRYLPDVEVYLKAAEWIVRHGEWLTADAGKQTLRVLDAGLERAKAAAQGKAPWADVRGKPVVFGYRSEVDGSVQPYSLMFPENFDPKDKTKKFRLDVVLHGRDATLTEVKFINGKENAKAGKAPDHFVMEVYGRGNNAYRWAGEADVFEAMRAAWVVVGAIDPDRVVLRGFSMGGAGTWHIGLHHPAQFCVIGPGAGFTTTHGYISGLPNPLPDYQEKCLRIYDAVDYAENAFDVPVVAYSGANDPQKKAADNIENALKGFKEPLRFTHLVAPGLEHKMPPEWQTKADAEYRKYADKGRTPLPGRERLVTYTPKYGRGSDFIIEALDETYKKAVVDLIRNKGVLTVTTSNVRRLSVSRDPAYRDRFALTIDGTAVVVKEWDANSATLEKRDGVWAELVSSPQTRRKLIKRDRVQGPIDDAFMERFRVVRPSTPGFTAALADRFAGMWDRYFRGTLPIVSAEKHDPQAAANLVLFGDPSNNPLIAKVIPGLPITWAKDKLVVNGVEYDARTHLPVLIYPNPLRPDRYVVLNSGHTFGEDALKGTNALLYPRLGDWAVIKPTPTAKDPAAFEVVAAGLFDENWQFPKKK
jgi:hypothetical protein